MSSGPDLFVVCKSCGSEVSPYITECPYCGTRLRKRAPKLERGGVPKAPRSARTRRQALPRLKPGEIPGIRADRRPWATWLLVLGSVGVGIALNAGLLTLDDVGLGLGAQDAWRGVTTLFTYTHTAYEIVVLAAVALFGWLLERRHGPWAPVLIFLVCGAAGALLAVDVAHDSVALGANGAALGMLAAWAVRDLRGRRRGNEDDSDMLGVLAIAALLVLMPIASQEASAIAGLAGGALGLVLGHGLARLPER
jgi:membrane associated rhomboid family serine protease